MHKVIAKIFLVLLISFSSSTFGQVEKEIELLYDEFLTYEFEDADRAKKAVEEGLKSAKQIQNTHLIGLGFKYLSWYHDDLFQTDQSLHYVDSSIHYFKAEKNQTELINAYNLKGNVLSDMALLDSSLIYYRLALKSAQEQNDGEMLNKVVNNIGLVYTDQGEYLKAIDFFHQSIDLCKSLGDEESLGDTYNNIGSLFTQIEDFDQAMLYHEMALKIRQKADDPARLSSVLLNIGRIHLTMRQFDKARDHFNQSLAIDRELNDLFGIGLNYNNIGLAYFEDDQLDSAKKYFQLSLDIRLQIEDPFGTATTYNNLGDFYNKTLNYHAAIDNCLSSYKISNKHGIPYEKLVSCNCLTTAYDGIGDIKRAYFYLQEFVEVDEFLSSEHNQKELTKNEMQYVFHYQTLEDSLKRAEIQAKKDAETAFQIKASELEREQALTSKRNQFFLFMMLGLFLATIAGMLYYSYKKQQKKTEVIRQKNEFIKHQKLEIDQSIEYARLIQHTALPSIELKDIFSSSFLMFLPRDVVSGDFFWLEENEDQAFFAVADCTGHGIPGAFISMIGTILLNEIYNSKKLRSPNEMLDELNRLIQLTLFSRTGEQMKDGMDIAFCRWDKKEKVLHYAGANNPLWVVSKNQEIQYQLNKQNKTTILPVMNHRSNNLFEVKADKQPIGKYNDDRKNFTLHSIQLSEGDMVYLFSDGYPDQFGGEHGKKFKYKPFKQQFLQVAHLSDKDQENILLKTLKDWQGNHEQIDDICIIGVRI